MELGYYAGALYCIQMMLGTPGLRRALRGVLGIRPYRGVFSLIAVGGFV